MWQETRSEHRASEKVGGWTWRTHLVTWWFPSLLTWEWESRMQCEWLSIEMYCALQHTHLTLRTVLDRFILNVTYERSHLWHLIWLTVRLWAIARLGAENAMYSEINTCLPQRSLCLASSFFFIFCWYFQCSRYVCSTIFWLMHRRLYWIGTFVLQSKTIPFLSPVER